MTTIDDSKEHWNPNRDFVDIESSSRYNNNPLSTSCVLAGGQEISLYDYFTFEFLFENQIFVENFWSIVLVSNMIYFFRTG